MTLHVAGPLSSLDPKGMAPSTTTERTIAVPVRTLDDILAEAGAPEGFEFLSIDVEGHEIDVLSGFTVQRWRPQLIMLEDHVPDLSRHRYLKRAGYRIIRRHENNGWYVPKEANIRCVNRWEIARKYYLALPLRMLRNYSRRLRGKSVG
jgi:Methyltransferase FkbM domain